VSGGSPDFYSAAAQVIPVLVIVVLLEQRAVRRVLDPTMAFAFVLSAVLAASIGEIVALRELYRDAAARTDQYYVIVPLAYLALVIVTPIIGTSLRAVQAAGGRVRVAVAWSALLLVAWALAVVALAVAH